MTEQPPDLVADQICSSLRRLRSIGREPSLARRAVGLTVLSGTPQLHVDDARAGIGARTTAHPPWHLDHVKRFEGDGPIRNIKLEPSLQHHEELIRIRMRMLGVFSGDIRDFQVVVIDLPSTWGDQRSCTKSMTSLIFKNATRQAWLGHIDLTTTRTYLRYPGQSATRPRWSG